MKSGCFACEVVVEGDDAEAVADRFVEHAAKDHDWSYPEHSLRQYAINYAAAVERVDGPTERLSAIGEVTVHPVTADRIDDWLRLFDREGFAGNPDWASCYCREPHEPPTADDPERLWSDNRAAMIERLRNGSTFGYLAYVDGKVAGWVNASTRDTYGKHHRPEPDGPDPASVIGVSCFVISPPYRKHGLAGALLDRVIADTGARGGAWVEGYPLLSPEAGDAGQFRGPRQMYDARGFEPVDSRESETVVRRPADRPA
jgi:GNAT superfamily N-acetyltransferase